MAKKQLMQHDYSACVIWLTGLSGSGKSTLAEAVSAFLSKMGIHSYILDGDKLRAGLSRDLGYSNDDREENNRRIAEVARLMLEAGIVVIVSAISPLKKSREYARNRVGKCNFIEVYMSCPLHVCESRDVKGLYKKARKGDIKEFTGISSIYETPDSPDIVIDSSRIDLEESVDLVFEFIKFRKKLVS